MYILITPAKNEESNIPEVANTVINQTIRPSLWLIVDDGSTDKTSQIIKDYEKNFSWINGLTLGPGKRDITFHYSHVCKCGFDHAIEHCKNFGIPYDYIGLLDADTELENEYFEKLINEFKKDERLGIASGGIYYRNGETLTWGYNSEKLPSGTGRLWAKKCFFETKGYEEKASPDSISSVKAILRDWKIRQFKSIIAIQRRNTSSVEGLWKGYRINGEVAHYLNKHPILVILNAANYTIKKPYYSGIAFIYGYLVSVVKRKKIIDDEEIRNYYWNVRFNEYKKAFVDKIRSPKARGN